MGLQVVGAGVGRTGTHSLKIALEQLLDGRCHHMLEILADPTQIPLWTDAMYGRPVDWDKVLDGYVAQVDWPGAAFWRELSDTYPDALVLLSVRDPESWYRSASNTIFLTFDHVPEEAGHMLPWLQAVRHGLAERFCDRFDDKQAMLDAFVRHNETVRATIPAARLLVWEAGDGWEPICERLELPVPTEPFPRVNTTDEFRAMLGMPALS
jgi:hypothetical protein